MRLAALGLGLGLGLVLVGCASASPSAADAVLASAVLPPGAQRVSSTIAGPAQSPACTPLDDVSSSWSVPGDVDAVVTFLAAHPPADLPAVTTQHGSDGSAAVADGHDSSATMLVFTIEPGSPVLVRVDAEVPGADADCVGNRPSSPWIAPTP